MKTILALLAILASTAAFPSCYLIYGPANELAWQGTRTPVPLDIVMIDSEVQKIVPQGHMVIVPDDAFTSASVTTFCRKVDLTTPRKPIRQKAKKTKHDRPDAAKL